MTSVVYRVRGFYRGVRIGNNAIIGISDGHTRAWLKRYLSLSMAMNERLVLPFIVEEVTGRRLSDGVSANSPSRDVELSASPPCRLLDRPRGRSRNSTQLKQARTLDSQCINL